MKSGNTYAQDERSAPVFGDLLNEDPTQPVSNAYPIEDDADEDDDDDIDDDDEVLEGDEESYEVDSEDAPDVAGEDVPVDDEDDLDADDDDDDDDDDDVR